MLLIASAANDALRREVEPAASLEDTVLFGGVYKKFVGGFEARLIVGTEGSRFEYDLRPLHTREVNCAIKGFLDSSYEFTGVPEFDRGLSFTGDAAIAMAILAPHASPSFRCARLSCSGIAICS